MEKQLQGGLIRVKLLAREKAAAPHVGDPNNHILGLLLVLNPLQPRILLKSRQYLGNLCRTLLI